MIDWPIICSIFDCLKKEKDKMSFQEQGRTTIQDLDLLREDLIKEEFGERCNFYIDDAVQKLENLNFVARDKVGKYYCVDPKLDNEIIGTTTEELVIIKAKQDGLSSSASLAGTIF